MTKAPNVVVGSGIVGLLAAWYLSEAGEKVVVLEKHRIGRESSWAGAGILSPLYPTRYPCLSSLVRHSGDEYPRLVREVLRFGGADPELIISQLIVLDKETMEGGNKGPERIVTGDALKQMEPALEVSSEQAGCYSIAQIRNPRFLSGLHTALRKKGVVFLEATGVYGFKQANGRLASLFTTGGVVEASRCIVGVGAWTGELLKHVGLALPIKPIKGQILVFAARPRLVFHVIVKNYHYLVPRMDGRILVGSTIEDAGFDKSPTLAARKALYSAAVSLVPALAQYPIEHHWAGLRPGSPDDAPFIGEHPGIKGLFVCAGHYRNGFATGPASARLVVDMMLGRPPSVDPTPFRLDRPCPEWKIGSQN